MKIKQVTIENFRNHKHTVIDFTDHHVLVGENGSGKTSVLVAINYALSSSFLSSRLDEQDFQNQDGGDIVVEVVFDEPFAVKMPDLYSNHQLLLADQVRLTAKRRDRAAPGKAFSDPFQTSTRIPALCYSDVKELAGKKLPGDLTVDKLPTSVTWFEKEDKRGYEVVRRSGNSTSYREDQVNLSQDAEGFPNVFYFDRKREKQSDVGFGSTLTRILSDLSWRYRKGWDQEKVLKTFEAFDKQVSGVVQKDADKRLWTDWKKLLGELLDEDKQPGTVDPEHRSTLSEGLLLVSRGHQSDRP
ncbi:MAG: AAA family ATPase [Flavobacteriales bacterium]|nr:AAA family ATPase [Flavobacteriales bacterium]